MYSIPTASRACDGGPFSSQPPAHLTVQSKLQRASSLLAGAAPANRLHISRMAKERPSASYSVLICGCLLVGGVTHSCGEQLDAACGPLPRHQLSACNLQPSCGGDGASANVSILDIRRIDLSWNRSGTSKPSPRRVAATHSRRTRPYSHCDAGALLHTQRVDVAVHIEPRRFTWRPVRCLAC